MKKTYNTVDIVNVISYLNTMDAEKLKALPTKIRWNLKKNVEKFAPIAKSFEDFRSELIGELQQEWFTDEKTEEATRPIKDKNGNPELNEDGSEKVENIKRIKDEYLAEFNKAVDEINDKLNDILSEQVEIDISPIDVDGFVESMDDESVITFEDLNALSVFQQGES